MSRLLLMLIMMMSVGDMWGYTITLTSGSKSVDGYEEAGYYNFQTNTPAVLPTSGDLRYRSDFGLHNYGSGTRSARVSIPVGPEDLLYLDLYSSDYVEGTSIDCGTKDAAKTSGGVVCFSITKSADHVTISVPRYGGVMAAMVLSKYRTYTVYAVDGSSNRLATLASGRVAKESAATVTVPRFVLKERTLHEIAQNSPNYYQQSFTPNANNYVKELAYTSTINDVVFYAEAEDISGSVGYNAARASKGMTGHTGSSTNYVSATTLLPGKYTIYTGNSSSHGEGNKSKASFKIGSYEALKYDFYYNVTHTANSSENVVTTASPLSFACNGSEVAGIDWFYVKAAYNVRYDGTAGTVSVGGHIDVKTYNARLETTFSSDDPSIATVENNGDGTITIHGIAVGSTTIGNSDSEEKYTVTVEKGTLSFASNQTAYLEDLLFAYTANSSSDLDITYSVPDGVADYERVAMINDNHSGTLRLIKPGSVVVSATDSRGWDPKPSYTLTVSTRNALFAPTSGTTHQFAAGTKSFDVGTTTGQVTSETIGIDDITMTLGDSRETQVVRRINGSYGLTCIDLNGYYFGNNDGGNPMTLYGTWYIFHPTESKYLSVSGYFDNAVSNALLVDATAGTQVATIDNTGTAIAATTFEQKLTAGHTYYLFAPWPTTFALSSFGYSDSRIVTTLDYETATASGHVIFKDEPLLPSVSVAVDGNSLTVADVFDVSYASDNSSVVTANASTGEIRGVSQGAATITATLTPKSGYSSTYPTITTKYQVYVTDGEWDIATEFGTGEGIRDNLNNAQWSYNTRNNRREDRIVPTTTVNGQTQYQYSWEFVEKEGGGLFSVTYGLQLWGQATFYTDKYLKLFSGVGVDGSNRSKIRIPVREGMDLKVRARADGEDVFIGISNVKAVDGSSVSEFKIDRDWSDLEFVVNSDGYVVIENNNSSLQLDINYIKASADIVFRDGQDESGEIVVYVPKNLMNYQNIISNGEGLTFSYELTEGSGTTILPADLDVATGVIAKFNNYGTAKVKVTCTSSGTLLYNKSRTYTFKVIDLEVLHSPLNATLNSDGETISDELNTYGEGSTHLELHSDLKLNTKVKTGESTYDDALRDKVQFTVSNISKPSTRANIVTSGSSQILTADGLGNITVTATLGNASQNFIYTVRGTAYKEVNPCIANTLEEYTCEIENTSGKTVSSKAFSIVNVLGNLDENTITINNEGKISNINKGNDDTCSKGGVIVVRCVVTYDNFSTETIDNIITVAYTQKTWNFHYSPLVSLTLSPDITHGIPSVDDIDIYAYDPYSDIDWPWRYEKKIKTPTNTTKFLYAYMKPLKRDNALLIAESEGLLITSISGKTGVNTSKTDIVISNGSMITIPQVLPGQQIDMYWERHTEDQGERIRVTNLLDARGTPITETYRIARTRETSGSYSFIAANANGDGTPVDVSFECLDKNWTNIYRIVLTDKHAITNPETGTTYVSTMTPLLGTFDNVTRDVSHVLADGQEHRINIASKYSMNVHDNGWPSWTYEADETFNGTVTNLDDAPVINYKDDWGKIRMTQSNYTQDKKYVSTWRTYIITIGKAPRQTYPYTWDFTKFRSYTNSNLSTDSWTFTKPDPTKTLLVDGYNTNNYTHYFVEGGQLVSYALRNNGNNGVLPEADGLGFELDTNSDDVPDAALSIEMANIVGNQDAAVEYKSWRDKSVGYLQIGTGGKIIVPKTGEAGYYIYVHSSEKPTATNTTDVSEAEGTDVNHAVTDGQYKFQVTDGNDDVELTFANDTKVYAIGVTKDFKPLKKLNGTGWATESRDYTVDYTLNTLLTTNAVQPYVIIERPGNPQYSDDKKQTTVSISDRRSVVPPYTGIILKQTESVPGADGNTFNVPLFVPAVTTADDGASSFAKNLMRPSYDWDNTNKVYRSEPSITFGLEQENPSEHGGDDLGRDLYIRFILTNSYMTWKKEGNNAATYDEHFTSADVPTFYRMHKFDNTNYDPDNLTGTNRNTLGPNKAYLLLKASKLTDPLWSGQSSPAPRRDYIAIEGVSDMEELEELEEAERSARMDNCFYNLNGQKVADGEATQLPRGIYIRNGKKIIVK